MKGSYDEKNLCIEDIYCVCACVCLCVYTKKIYI